MIDQKKSKLYRFVRPLGSILLLLVGILVANMYLDFEELLFTLTGADRRIISFAALIYFISLYVRGYRYYYILNHIGYKYDIWYLTAIVCISQSINHIVPARGGDVIRVVLIRLQNKLSYSAGLASVTIDRVLDLFAITVLLLWVLMSLLLTQTISLSELYLIITNTERSNIAIGFGASALLGIATLGGIIVIFITQRLELPRLQQFPQRYPSGSIRRRTTESIQGYISDVQKLGNDIHSFLYLAILSLFLWGIQTAVALIILLSFDISIPILNLVTIGVLAIAVANLAKAVPLTPGGVGLYEGAFAIIIINFTPLPWDIALAAAILDHALKNFLTIAVGIGSIVKLNIPILSVLRKINE